MTGRSPRRTGGKAMLRAHAARDHAQRNKVLGTKGRRQRQQEPSAWRQRERYSSGGGGAFSRPASRRSKCACARAFASSMVAGAVSPPSAAESEQKPVRLLCVTGNRPLGRLV